MADPIVLVTGGAGFIGHRVARMLVDEGFRPRVFDNRYRADDAMVEEFQQRDDIDWVEGDVRYRGRIERAMADVEGVIHLAAVCINKSVADPTESFDVNLTGSDNVFNAAAAHGVRRVVFASSASVYGDPESLPMSEDDPLKPQTPYCIAKVAAENLLRFYERTAGLSWNTLRYFNVYGPGQPVDAYYTSVINLFVRRILAVNPRRSTAMAASRWTSSTSTTSPGPRCGPTCLRTTAWWPTSVPGSTPASWMWRESSSTSSVSTSSRCSDLVTCWSIAVPPMSPAARELLDFKAEIDVRDGLAALAREVVSAYRAEHG